MAAYQIQINERTSLGKNLVALLQSIPQVVTFKKREKKEAPKSELYHSLDRAFRDVRLMMDGKKKEKTIEEFLEEMRKERANELI
jgi:hypothetical protein